jgi:cardiolipin synthase A/B
VLLDGFGNLAMPPAYRETLVEAGCQVATFRPLTPATLGRLTQRNHRRILVIDGRVGFTGGSGVSRQWMGNGQSSDHWRYTDVRVDGPVVEYLQRAYVENWQEATGRTLHGRRYFPRWSRWMRHPGDVEARVVHSAPAEGRYDIYRLLRIAIASATQSIHLTTPYLLSTDDVADSLAEAARRGIQVVILTQGRSDHSLVHAANRAQVERLLEAGVEVHKYTAALLHAKTMVIDGVCVTVGSANLDKRSLALNDELNLVLYDLRLARRLDAIFAEDLTRSARLDLAQVRSRGVGDRLLEFLATPVEPQF